MKSLFVSLLGAGALLALSSTAQAGSELPTGLFVSASVGGAGIETQSIGLVETGDTEHGNGAGKVSVGYWFSQHWGVAASYAELGKFTQTYTTGSFRGRVRSAGVSLLGRLPVNERWSLIGKLAINYNKTTQVSVTGDAAQFAKLQGHPTRLVFPGFEVNYRLSPAASLFFEMESRGKAAESLKTGYAGFGLRWQF
ncbi:MAG: outer membrane beta-barrel protein [Burkholderiaceae bacterium]